MSKLRNFKNWIDFNWLSYRKLNEITVLENSVNAEKNKQNIHKNHMIRRAELLINLRFAIDVYQRLSV